MTTRPNPPAWGTEDGTHAWVVVPEDPEKDGWTLDPAVLEGKRCRFGSQWRGFCRRPAEVALNRALPRTGRRPIWYGYCADHMYGRWIEDGVVVGWRLRRVER